MTTNKQCLVLESISAWLIQIHTFTRFKNFQVILLSKGNGAHYLDYNRNINFITLKPKFAVLRSARELLQKKNT